MDPVAFTIRFGSHLVPIRWYGVCTALGFLAGMLLAQHRAGKNGFGRQNAADLTVAAMFGGILGARLLYVVKELGYFMEHPASILNIREGGVVFYGGFAGGALAVMLLCRLRRLPILDAADIFAAALPLGHAFGRLGCFINGCCFGRPWPHWGGVQYPFHSAVTGAQMEAGLIPPHATSNLPVLPVQLIEAVLNIGICVVLLKVSSRLRRRGQLFYLYMALYAVVRFAVEFGRGDYDAVQRTAGILTPAQLSCLVILPLAAAFFVWGHRLLRTPQNAGR